MTKSQELTIRALPLSLATSSLGICISLIITTSFILLSSVVVKKTGQNFDIVKIKKAIVIIIIIIIMVRVIIR